MRSNSFCRARKVILKPVFLFRVELVFGKVSSLGNNLTQCWCLHLQKILILGKTKEDIKPEIGLNRMQILSHSMLSICKPNASSIKSLSGGYSITTVALLLNLYPRIRAGRDPRRRACLSLTQRHISHSPNFLISPNRCFSYLFFKKTLLWQGLQRLLWQLCQCKNGPLLESFTWCLAAISSAVI